METFQTKLCATSLHGLKEARRNAQFHFFFQFLADCDLQTNEWHDPKILRESVLHLARVRCSTHLSSGTQSPHQHFRTLKTGYICGSWRNACYVHILLKCISTENNRHSDLFVEYIFVTIKTKSSSVVAPPYRGEGGLSKPVTLRAIPAVA